MKKIHIFAEIRIFDMEGGITWIAAATKHEAAECFAGIFDYDWNDKKDLERFRAEYPNFLDGVEEVSPEQMKSLTYVKDENGIKSEMSFGLRLEEMKSDGEIFPRFFATSEY